MRSRANRAVPSPATRTILDRLRIAAMLLLSMLAFDAPSAHALPPPANGGNCTINWVNNPGALDCFVQGEQDIRNGVKNPHYVGCNQAGEIFCCVDEAAGQNCEVVSAKTGRIPSQGAQIGAILDTQRTILMKLNSISDQVDDLQNKMNQKSH